MNAAFRLSSILGCLVLVLTCLGCDGVGTTVSDVPCVSPPEWDFTCLLTRAAEEGSDVLLVTGQTTDQRATDRSDGSRDFRPHNAVYRLDPAVGSFELVNDRVWDDAESTVISCRGSMHQSPFIALGFFTPRLEYNGSIVAVAGGNALLVRSSPTRAVAGVLSSAGFSPGAPFVSSGIGTGQHYHQLFSEIDGLPLGDPVRVGVGDALVDGCWTAEEEYVIYWQRKGDVESGVFTVCAVPVTEDLPPLEGE